MGIQAWLEEQLAADTLEDTACSLRIRHLQTLEMSAVELFDASDRLFDGQDRITVPEQLQQATLLRQVYSRRGLYEVMVEFWSDHFNISLDKGDCTFLKTVDDREVIRPHVLGRFHDLLWASAHSPAMLVYLDNQSNQRGAPNENYARELMELHTLGIDGGYTQNDVMQLARCLTGWSVKDHFWRGDFVFRPDLHDDGSKIFLGQTIPPAGQAEAEDVLERLASHPTTARYLSTKLARRLLADLPPPQIVEAAAQVFLATGGDIRLTLRKLLLDGLSYIEPKYKRPARFVVSALRLLEAHTDGAKPVQDFLTRMGQAYFSWPTPDGYPDLATAWQGNLLPRWQFALALAAGEIQGTHIDLHQLSFAAPTADPPMLCDRLALALIGRPLPVQQRDALLDSLAEAGAGDTDWAPALVAGLLASPSYHWF
jgi:uncharacterized protein (DUF1800 family)